MVIMIVIFGAGDDKTAAARSGMYEVNKFLKKRRGYLPNNPWLQGDQGGPLPTNMNINLMLQCVLRRLSQSIFIAKAAVAEIPVKLQRVFDHEWGHGMDDNDSGGSSALQVKDMLTLPGCIVYGHLALVTDFYMSGSSVAERLQMELVPIKMKPNKEPMYVISIVPEFVMLIISKLPVELRLALSLFARNCFGGGGPCGRQVHCAATPTREAAWNLVARELQNAPEHRCRCKHSIHHR